VPASLARRALAFVVDLLVIGTLFVPAFAVVAVFEPRALEEWPWLERWPLPIDPALAIPLAAISAGYLIPGVRRGGTKGDRAAGVVILGRDGSHPSLGQAVNRYLGGFVVPFAVPWILLAVLGVTLGDTLEALVIGYAAELALLAIWIALTPTRRGWHDQLAGTFVERAPEPR
jgi:uncharacterized RDD family membrane protein YckC